MCCNILIMLTKQHFFKSLNVQSIEHSVPLERVKFGLMMVTVLVQKTFNRAFPKRSSAPITINKWKHLQHENKIFPRQMKSTDQLHGKVKTAEAARYPFCRRGSLTYWFRTRHQYNISYDIRLRYYNMAAEGNIKNLCLTINLMVQTAKTLCKTQSPG